jgi:hypothetical protein
LMPGLSGLLGLLGRRGGAVAWTPAALSDPAAWYTAGPTWCFSDAAGTIPCGDGDPIYVWNDRSGNAVTMTQATLAKRPVLTALGGGLWAATFDGVDDGIGSGPALSGATTLSFRVASADAGANRRLLKNSNPESNSLVALRRTNGNSIYVDGMLSDDVLVADADPHTFLMRKAAAGNWGVRLDGSPLAVAANANDFGTVWFGFGSAMNASEGFGGDVAGMVFTDARVSDDDAALLESYLASLYP